MRKCISSIHPDFPALRKSTNSSVTTATNELSSCKQCDTSYCNCIARWTRTTCIYGRKSVDEKIDNQSDHVDLVSIADRSDILARHSSSQVYYDIRFWWGLAERKHIRGGMHIRIRIREPRQKEKLAAWSPPRCDSTRISDITVCKTIVCTADHRCKSHNCSTYPRSPPHHTMWTIVGRHIQRVAHLSSEHSSLSHRYMLVGKLTVRHHRGKWSCSIFDSWESCDTFVSYTSKESSDIRVEASLASITFDVQTEWLPKCYMVFTGTEFSDSHESAEVMWSILRGKYPRSVNSLKYSRMTIPTSGSLQNLSNVRGT